ncbi:hypothetical protein [Microbacterium protaetiae]|uniref:hypothetical protein n=1 Tax=Microbacterium protaetiae TaxID=2509458 RepID=UPI001A92B00C|nr:hypothetical protein [Microbacterium protaetiae]
MHGPAHRFDRRGGDAVAMRVDGGEFVDDVAALAHLADDPHAFGEVVTQPPEVDDVPVGAAVRRPLEDHRLVSVSA